MGNLAYERTDGQFTPLTVCQEFYRNSSIDPGNETFHIDPHIDKGKSVFKEYDLLIKLMGCCKTTSLIKFCQALFIGSICRHWFIEWMENNHCAFTWDCIKRGSLQRNELYSLTIRFWTHCPYLLSTDCISIFPVQSVDNSSATTRMNFSLDFKRWLN